MAHVPPHAGDDAQYYERLGLGPAASHDDVVHAYRRLALALHPDTRPGDPEAPRQFREITEAYDVLTDPGRRAADDRPGQRRPIPVRRVGVGVGERPWQGTTTPWRRDVEDPPVFLGERAACRVDDVPLRAGPTQIERGCDVDAGISNDLSPRAVSADVLFALVDSWWTS